MEKYWQSTGSAVGKQCKNVRKTLKRHWEALQEVWKGIRKAMEAFEKQQTGIENTIGNYWKRAGAASERH